jgi:hypothetical protein
MAFVSAFTTVQQRLPTVLVRCGMKFVRVSFYEQSLDHEGWTMDLTDTLYVVFVVEHC